MKLPKVQCHGHPGERSFLNETILFLVLIFTKRNANFFFFGAFQNEIIAFTNLRQILLSFIRVQMHLQRKRFTAYTCRVESFIINDVLVD